MRAGDSKTPISIAPCLSGGVRPAVNVGAPRTQQRTHAHTHDSAPHVSGSTEGSEAAPRAWRDPDTRPERWPRWRELLGTLESCSRRERRSAKHTTAHTRRHTRERTARQWQHGRQRGRTSRLARSRHVTERWPYWRELLGALETGGGVRPAAAASVGAPRTPQHTHANTHESAVSGSTAGVAARQVCRSSRLARSTHARSAGRAGESCVAI